MSISNLVNTFVKPVAATSMADLIKNAQAEIKHDKDIKLVEWYVSATNELLDNMEYFEHYNLTEKLKESEQKYAALISEVEAKGLYSLFLTVKN